MRKQDRKGSRARAAPDEAEYVASDRSGTVDNNPLGQRRRKYSLAEYGDLQARLSANLRILRLQRGWTHAQAAAQCELDTRFYQKIESGTLNTTFVSLARLARGFGVDAIQLLRPIEPLGRGEAGGSA